MDRLKESLLGYAEASQTPPITCGDWYNVHSFRLNFSVKLKHFLQTKSRGKVSKKNSNTKLQFKYFHEPVKVSPFIATRNECCCFFGGYL